MRTERALAATGPEPGGRLTAALPPQGRPLERAQVVWRRALEPIDAGKVDDRPALALALLRVAHLDAATMAHALALGRARLRDHPTDTAARRGVRTLERAIAFLGVKPRANDEAVRPRLTVTTPRATR